MITLEMAINIARKQCKNSMIRTVFEYGDEYRFLTSPGKYFAVDDPTVGVFVVNRITGETHGETVTSMAFSMLKMKSNEREKAAAQYNKAMRSMQPVDLTEEQWEELKRYMDQF